MAPSTSVQGKAHCMHSKSARQALKLNNSSLPCPARCHACGFLNMWCLLNVCYVQARSEAVCFHLPRSCNCGAHACNKLLSRPRVGKLLEYYTLQFVHGTLCELRRISCHVETLLCSGDMTVLVQWQFKPCVFFVMVTTSDQVMVQPRTCQAAVDSLTSIWVSMCRAMLLRWPHCPTLSGCSGGHTVRQVVSLRHVFVRLRHCRKQVTTLLSSTHNIELIRL